MTTPSLYQVGAVFMKLETTPGTEAAPTTTGSPNDYIQAIDAQFAPDFTLINRNYMRPSLSATPHLMGRRLASLTFSTEVFGTGVAAVDTDATTQAQATPKWADLLEACAYTGVAAAIPLGKTYSPKTGNAGSAQKTATFYCYYDGMLHKITGAMGTFTMTATAGEIATIQWTFTGVFNDPTAVATPTPSFTSVTPPLVEQCSFTMNSVATLLAETLTIDAGNSVIQRADANSAKGFNSMYVTARGVKFNTSVEFVPEATYSFWGDFTAATARAISFNIGTSAGNKMIVTIPSAQIEGLTYADKNGVRAYEASFNVMSTSDAGDDEVTFRFT